MNNRPLDFHSLVKEFKELHLQAYKQCSFNDKQRIIKAFCIEAESRAETFDCARIYNLAYDAAWDAIQY